MSETELPAIVPRPTYCTAGLNLSHFQGAWRFSHIFPQMAKPVCLPPRTTSIERAETVYPAKGRLVLLGFGRTWLAEERNLEQPSSRVPTTGAIQRLLDGLLPAIPGRPAFGRKPESMALWSFPTLQIPWCTDLWTTCRLLPTWEVAVLVGKPSFSRGYRSIFPRKAEG